MPNAAKATPRGGPTTPPLQRSAEGIADVLALRAGRAIDHFSALATDGPELECPCCGYVGRFSPVRAKPSIWCPSCDSRPRHRLISLWLGREGTPPGARILHFAAEPCLVPALREAAAEYVTADIHDRYDLTLDITAMQVPDESFDVVMANHVLEHVDDRAALAEVARILSPGGLAILTVPLVAGWDRTLENPAWTSAEDRARHYTDATHLRMYGADFPDRIEAAGLTVSIFTAEEPDVARHGLHRGEKVFLARKPARPTQGADHG